ncbi:NAD-dependent epimerase/dehydratase family protein [Hyalangium minutum]|uniref:UDP-glucose 4-epimerase n=1 Tax=Hyalangium minutum TaxID=394096 RepID=A0A085WN29_9BACT|nr:NAD(P)-dependent oxidoreductase [Hyalangium minutum]KFE69092.1 UDP-glucose 4-epimerase [Hyalangium minutum]
MELRDKGVLVTGANGFVGSYVVQRLLTEGMRVRAVVRKPEAQAELERAGVEVLLGDITDARVQEAAVRGVSCVVHTAASAAPELPEARRVNTQATASLAEAALAAGCQRFVHISTVAVYPLRNRSGVVEEAVPLLTSGDAYGLSKAEAEQALNAVAAKGLSTVILRPGAILGVHPTSTWGAVFPPFIAEGKFPHVDDGNTTMGYLHISSLTEAVVLALRADQASGQTFNIIDGHVPWYRYTRPFARGTLPSHDADQVPEFLSFRGRFSNEKAQRVLGFVPRNVFESSIEEIVRAQPKK